MKTAALILLLVMLVAVIATVVAVRLEDEPDDHFDDPDWWS